MEVALVTHEGLPGLADDDQRLVPALERFGIRGRAAVWSDPTVPWDQFVGCVLRSTWDYYLQREKFLDWVDRMARVTRLWNPAPVVHWNSHKSYLRDLEDRRISVVPTVWSDGSKSLLELLDEHGWDRIVFKPAVSAAAHRTYVATRETLEVSEPLYRDLCSEQTVLVQPYMAGTEDPGEHSLVFLDEAFSHAVDRPARLSPRGGPTGGQPVLATAEERTFGHTVLRAVGSRTLYARVDTVRDSKGTLCLMELELVEPSLFLAADAEAPTRLAAAIATRLRESAAD
ncbi:MAG: hypothetical protein L3K10_08230 [Thermoplasmata archaeon]|nr:hypothetical protein [Thermoplasmata archaeon]